MKILIIATLMMFLMGCQREFVAVVENRSDSDIAFISQSESKTEKIVRSKQNEKVYVYPGCQGVQIKNQLKFIILSNVPREAWVSKRQGKIIEFKVVYDGNAMYLKTINGDKHELHFSNSCEST